MSEQYVVDHLAPVYVRINRAAARLCTFALAAAAAFILTLSAYLEEFRATHVGAALLVLNALLLVWHRRLIWRREFAIYSCFVSYMFIALLWTHDVDLAMNTLVPAVNCILVMVFFSALIRFSNVSTALLGALCGFAAGAALYTLTQGFPFHYPEVFSYNAIASMYLFGLFLTLMASCFMRSYGLFLAIAVVIMMHIVATTSIKANIGIVLGLIAAGIMYFGHFKRLLRRKALLLAVLACVLGFAIASNRGLVDAMDRGVQRVTVGVKVLQARDDVAGYSAYEQRDYWKQAGIDGWKLNPVFGYGTEAFRDQFGITSHSTPIDLLYNYGLIGLILFYSVFASVAWRLLQLEMRQATDKRSLILAGLVCYLFVSLSGTMHYNVFLAAFVGISVALLTSPGNATLARGIRKAESQ